MRGTTAIRNLAMAAAILATGAGGGTVGRAETEPQPRPNVVLIVCDNLGYGDVQPFGDTSHRTPALTRMAREGLKLTHCYAASGVCTPSRAALMTGVYPLRVGMAETDGAVLRPVSRFGLNPGEATLAEVLRDAGYATAAMGKWHLGDQPPFLPTRQGFDRFLGIPYSDDMTPRPGKPWPPLPWMEDERVAEAPVDRDLLTRRLTEAAVHWLRQPRDRPCFLYLAHCMPGSTTAPFASPAFRGQSANGPWGDAIEELDWSLGQVLQACRETGDTRPTLVVWTSDNGAPRRNPPQGSNGELAGWGYTTAEGGMRVPCLAWWPGVIPAGTESSRLVTLMDWLPTLAAAAGAAAPAGLDGRDLGPFLRRPADEAFPPHPGFLYYQGERVEAVRRGPWKLYCRGLQSAERLYNVREDPGERRDVLADRPEQAQQLLQLARSLARRAASTRRPVGYVAQPVPLR